MRVFLTTSEAQLRMLHHFELYKREELQENVKSAALAASIFQFFVSQILPLNFWGFLALVSGVHVFELFVPLYR